MERKSLLDGKKVLIVDDEPDILDTLEDLLPMCRVVKASSFEEAETLLDSQNFDLAIAQDLITAYMGNEGLDHLFRVMESLVLRIKRPGAICVLTK